MSHLSEELPVLKLGRRESSQILLIHLAEDDGQCFERLLLLRRHPRGLRDRRRAVMSMKRSMMICHR